MVHERQPRAEIADAETCGMTSMTPSSEALAGVTLAAELNTGIGVDAPHVFTPREDRPEAAVATMSDGRSLVSVIPGVDTYILRFRRQDWEWAHGASPDTGAVAEAALAWLAGTGLEEMARRWPFVEFSELELAYERGDALETQWRIVRRDASEPDRELLELAARNPTVSRFFPTLGHNLLLMPDPFDSRILASVLLLAPGRFQLWAPGRSEPLAEGPRPP